VNILLHSHIGTSKSAGVRVFRLTGAVLAIVLPGLSSSAQAGPLIRQEAPASPQQAATPAPPCPGLPPGRHSLLERMTATFGLTCEQELQIEPLLHNEESVSKPLLRFAAFSPEEKRAVMLKIKVAARRQILPLLTPDQQIKMRKDIEVVSRNGNEAEVLKGGLEKNGGGEKNQTGSSKKHGTEDTNGDPFEAEETLSQALSAYTALSAEERTTLILQVKQAALRDDQQHLTPEQKARISKDIEHLQAGEPSSASSTLKQ